MSKARLILKPIIDSETDKVLGFPRPVFITPLAASRLRLTDLVAAVNVFFDTESNPSVYLEFTECLGRLEIYAGKRGNSRRFVVWDSKDKTTVNVSVASELDLVLRALR